MGDSLMRTHITTDDPDKAHHWLRGAYADHSVKLSGDWRTFRFTHGVADGGHFKVGVARHTMTLKSRWEPLGDRLLFCHLLAGRFTPSCRSREVVAGPGDVFSYDPDVPTHVDWSDVRIAQVRLGRAAADRVVTDILGDDRGGRTIGFELARPVSAAKALHWKRLMRYVTSDVATSPVAHGSPLVMSQVFRLILAGAIETFPNTAFDGVQPGAPAAAPAAVRRAMDFIAEHAGEEIDLTAIAGAAQVGPRALQRAFRRATDTTPLAHLRHVRLDRAHSELRTADPDDGTTVAGVAARWGFGNPGRFAADYRRRFGRSPGETLRD